MSKANRIDSRFSWDFFPTFIVLFFISISFCYPQIQTLRFEHLTTDNGLSHNYVRCIVQDDQGFMWFGAFDGLNKFDGYHFTVYRHRDNDPSDITSNFIRSMYKVCGICGRSVSANGNHEESGIHHRKKSVRDGRSVIIEGDGVGFDMNYSGRLFEAFQRQHPDYEGKGIEITTVKRIIHRHGGLIWAECKENDGATFYFTQ